MLSVSVTHSTSCAFWQPFYASFFYLRSVSK